MSYIQICTYKKFKQFTASYKKRQHQKKFKQHQKKFTTSYKKLELNILTESKFDELLKELDNRLKNLEKLSSIMNQMQDVAGKIQEQAQENPFVDLIDVKDIDEAAFALLKNLQSIDINISRGTKSIQPKSYDFLNYSNIKKALLERGIQIKERSEGETRDYFNNTVLIGINHLVSKTKTRVNAKKKIDKIVSKTIKKSKKKSKRRKKKK